MLEWEIEKKWGRVIMEINKKYGLKKKDKILIIMIICIAALAFLAHMIIGGKGANKVTVKVNGVIEGTYSLSEDREVKINGGTNLLQIKNGRADMIEADCPDQLCVNQKAISLNHENIICLPNKVIVEVESSEESEIDAVTK